MARIEREPSQPPDSFGKFQVVLSTGKILGRSIRKVSKRNLSKSNIQISSRP